MKIDVQIQHEFKNITTSVIEKKVKDTLKNQGVKMNTIDTLDIYYKIEENAIYYVVKTKDNKIFGTGNTPLVL